MMQLALEECKRIHGILVCQRGYVCTVGAFTHTAIYTHKTALLRWPRHYTGYVGSLSSFSPHLQGKPLEVQDQWMYMP